MIIYQTLFQMNNIYTDEIRLKIIFIQYLYNYCIIIDYEIIYK